MELIKEGYTRISDILSIFQGYGSVPREKLKKAQEVGTAIHSAIEAHYNDGFSPLDRKLAPYFESFLKFDVSHDLSQYTLENRLYDDSLMITGKPDLVGLCDDIPVILDWKTGSWAHPKIWRLQGVFYRHLLQVNNLHPPDKFIFVQLQKDGTAPVLHEIDFVSLDYCLIGAAMRFHTYFTSQ